MSNSLVNPLIYGAFQLWPGRRRRGSNRFIYFYADKFFQKYYWVQYVEQVPLTTKIPVTRQKG